MHARLSMVCLGLVVVVIGTFLPWLRSGSVDRNSYAVGGAVRRLLPVHGAAEAALSAWPFVGLLCATAIGLILFGLVRTGAAVAAATALVCAVVSAWVLTTSGQGVIRRAALGPSTTLAGAVITVLAVITCFAPHARRNT